MGTGLLLCTQGRHRRSAGATNTQMWDQDLTKIEGLEAAVLADLERSEPRVPGCHKSCL